MPHPLKTILWKELRENWKWAGLGMLCLAFAELYALYQPTGYGTVALTSQVFILVSICGSVLIGAALGALQILPELDRDRWAALLHRPVPRTTLFLGKVIAGLILYLLATGIPLLLSIVCFAIPGQFAAPFIPGIVPPAIANALLGMVFYAAAVLVSLTRGLWYGRRTLLVLAVLPLLIIVPASPWIFLPTLLTSVVLLTAAWGTMAGNGAVRAGLRTAQFSLGLLLFVGLEIVFGIALFALNFLPGAGSQVPPDFESRYPVVATDGKVFLNVYRGGRSGPTLLNLDGTSVTDEKYLGADTAVSTTSPMPLCWDLKSDRDYSMAVYARDPHSLINFVQTVYGDNAEGTEYWYYLAGKDYFVGYDKLTHRRIGICDRDGFHPADHPPRPFPKPVQMPLMAYYHPRLGWIDGQLYGLDFPDRGLRPYFTAPSGSIHAAIGLIGGQKAIYFALALDTAIQILDLEGKQIVTIPYSHDRASLPDVSVCTIPSGDRIFVQYEALASTHDAPGRTPQPTFIDEIDLQGKVLHSYSFVTPHYRPWSGWARHVALVGTPLLPTTIAAIVDTLSSKEANPMRSSVFDHSDPNAYSWRALLLISAAIGALAAAVAYRWARQAGISRHETAGWLIFTFCLGIPGLVAFRLTAPFPTRIVCPTCSRKRSLQTEQCPSCHQAWPAPASNGTEVFAAL